MIWFFLKKNFCDGWDNLLFLALFNLIILGLCALAFFAAHLYPGIMLQPAEEVRRFSLTSFFCFTGIALSIAVETDDRNARSVALLLAIPL